MYSSLPILHIKLLKASESTKLPTSYIKITKGKLKYEINHFAFKNLYSNYFPIISMAHVIHAIIIEEHRKEQSEVTVLSQCFIIRLIIPFTYYIFLQYHMVFCRETISREYLFVLCMHTILHESDTPNVAVVPLNDIVCIMVLYIFNWHKRSHYSLLGDYTLISILILLFN